MKSWLPKGGGLLIAALLPLLLFSCASSPDASPSGTVTETTDYSIYKQYLPGLVARQQALDLVPDSERDSSFDYRAGYIRKALPEELVFDSESAALYVADEYIVSLANGYSVDDFIAGLLELDIPFELVGYVPTFSMIQMRSPVELSVLSAKLMTLSSVVDLQRNYIQLAQQQGTLQVSWQIADYALPDIWNESRGAGVRVAVIDSGLDTSLEPFAGRIVHPYSVVTGSSEFEDEVFTFDGDLQRVIDHGTKVSGVLGAAAGGAVPSIGVAPGVDIMPIQVLGFSVISQGIFTSDLMVVEGMARAVEFKADVISLSLGSDYSFIYGDNPGMALDEPQVMNRIISSAVESSRVYDPAVNACLQRGISVVVSAGNDGLPVDIQPLASHSGTIAVGAIDRDGRVAGYSNFGEGVSCYAPGTDVIVLGSGGNLFRGSGTSFAAPYVAGIIALAKSDAFSHGRNLSPRTIITSLKETNSEGRLSILPGNSRDLFMPVDFFNRLGGHAEYSDNQLSRYSEFRNKYQAYFINPVAAPTEDDDYTRLRKIFMFYARRGAIDSGRDAEARYARNLLESSNDDFNYAINWIARGASGDYYAALIIKDMNLSAARMDQVYEKLPRSDFFAIILSSKNYRGREDGFLQRLEDSPEDFNGNTLYGLVNTRDPLRLKAVADYLDRIQSNGTGIKNDEHIACYVLTLMEQNILGSVSRRTETLLRTSVQRLINSRDRFIYQYDREWTGNVLLTMSKALINAKSRAGLLMSVEALRLFSRDPEPGNPAVQTEYYLQEFQKLLNANTSFGFAFNYRSSPAQRRIQLDRFEAAINSSELVNGRWR